MLSAPKMLLIGSGMLALQSTAYGEQIGQFCWAFGNYDCTVYFAASEQREDRSQSFRDLLQISGIEFAMFECKTQGAADHRELQRTMIESWQRTELEVIDTTFLSDLDY